MPSAVFDGQGHAPHDATRPPFQRHPLGLGTQSFVGGSGGTTEAAEMSGGPVNAHQCDEQAVVVALDGNIQGLHGSTVAAQ